MTKLHDIDPEIIRNLYWNDELSLTKIASIYNVNPADIRYFMKKHSILCRSRIEALTKSWNAETRTKRSELSKKIWQNMALREQANIARKQTWANPELRKKAGEKTKQAWQNQEYRETLLQSRKEMWQNQEYRTMQSNLRIKRWANPEYKEKISKAIQKAWQNPILRDKQGKLVKERWQNIEYKENLSKIMKNVLQNPELRARKSEIMKTICQAPIYRENMIKLGKQNWQDINYRENIIKQIRERSRKPEYLMQLSKRMLALWQTPLYRDKLMLSRKEMWQNPNYLKNWFAGINRTPNKPESLLSILTSDNVEYVGNGKWWRTLKLETADGVIVKHKNPDFKVKKQKKVIEFHGRYWHRNDYPDEVWFKAWAKIGYEVLIIWEEEMSNIDNVLTKIGNFIGQQQWQMQLAI